MILLHIQYRRILELTAMAELPPEAAAYQRSHIDEDESQELGAYYIACIAASFVCMVSKITSRRVARVGLKSDDFAFLVGAVWYRMHTQDLIAKYLSSDHSRRLFHCFDDLW